MVLVGIAFLLLQRWSSNEDTLPPCFEKGASDSEDLSQDCLAEIQIVVFSELLRKYSAVGSFYSGPNYFLAFEERDPESVALTRLSRAYPTVFPASLLEPDTTFGVRDIEGRVGVLLSISSITLDSGDQIVVCASVFRNGLAAEGGEVIIQRSSIGWHVKKYDVQWVS